MANRQTNKSKCKRRFDSADGAASAIDEYLQLYESYLDSLIRWSEGDPDSTDPFLRPQYLHLHESDIGGTTNYRMWRELATFVEQLGEFHHELDAITFCHSWEPNNCQPPEACERSKFFYYELPSPTLPVDPRSFSVPGGSKIDSGSLGRMEPVEINSQLRHLLTKSNWFQTYILRCSPSGFTHHSDLMPSTPENVNEALEFFADQSAGGYQFTMYGYTFKESSRTLTASEQAFLRHVFVLHIITWNFKLRSAHEQRELFANYVKEAREKWQEGRRHFDAVHMAVDRALLAIEGVAEGAMHSDSHILPCDGEIDSHLFNNPHDLGEFLREPRENFSKFLEKLGHLRNRYPKCHEFAVDCGSERYIQAETNLNDDEASTWFTGIWLANRLLTRHLTGRNAADQVRLGVDHILLAVCSGLRPPPWASESPSQAATHVEFVGRGFKSERDFRTQCSISASTEGNWSWPVSQWEVTQSEERRFEATWRREGTNASEFPLEDLVRAGVLRADVHADERFQVVVPRQSAVHPYASAEMLGRLSSVISLLAYPTEERYVELSCVSIRYECTIHETTGKPSAVCEIELECQGSLSQIDKLKGETDGNFNRHWTPLLACLNQTNRGFIYDGRKSPGLAVRENKAGQTLSILLTLESSRNTWG